MFSSFSRGAPGIGLLLARMAFGLDLLIQAVIGIRQGGTTAEVLLRVSSAGIGAFVLVGLWTRLAAVLIALASVVYFLLQHGDWWHWMLLSNVGITLALLGPGAWSLDARLSGWKRIEIPRR
jgi:putative oxidoreductase